MVLGKRINKWKSWLTMTYDIFGWGVTNPDFEEYMTFEDRTITENIWNESGSQIVDISNSKNGLI